MATLRIPQHLRSWIDARRRHHLSHAHVQMARELGLNPTKLGKIDNHGQEPWKAPLSAFIERIYTKRFGRTRPELVLSIEERARLDEQKRAVRKEAKRLRRAGLAGVPPATTTGLSPDDETPPLAGAAREKERD